jgi:23S rRNA pseudouridine2604 synthase
VLLVLNHNNTLCNKHGKESLLKKRLFCFIIGTFVAEMKIDKYIGQNGYTSRRKAFVLIEEKRVTVNGKIANFSTKVNKGDVVMIDGEKLAEKEFVPVYIAYHKPKGIVCTTEKIENNIVDAINFPERIYPVGRLDKDSEGLILLTNHGELIDKIANPAFEHEKEYVVTLNLPVRTKFLKEISEGIEIMGEVTKPCKVSEVEGTKRLFNIVLTQGMNRQIRRMCNAYDYQVLKLQRVRVMHITLGKLKPGEWRHLSEAELKELFSVLEKPVI